MRSRALPLALALPLLAGCNVTFGEGSKETITWKGPVAESARFAFRNRNGSVRVEEATGDSAEVVLTVTRRRGSAKATTLEVLQDARGLVACVKYAADDRCSADGYESDGSTAGRSVSAVVRLPRGHALDVLTGNSSITVRVPTAAAVLRTSNSRVRIADVAGPLEITTSNGSVRATALRGPVTVKTSNASVGIALDTLVADVAIETSNGSVEAELPTSASATLRATTSNGSLALLVPGTIRSKDRGLLDAVLGAGAHRVTVATSNASVTVKPRASGGPVDDDN